MDNMQKGNSAQEIGKRLIELLNKFDSYDLDKTAKEFERIAQFAHSEDEKIRVHARARLDKVANDFSVMTKNFENLANFIDRKFKIQK